MRILGPVLLLASTGCSPNAFHFEHRSSLATEATSMALYADGRVGVGTMNHQTCTFDTEAASIVGDYDVVGADETVEDTRGEFAITRAPDGLHLLSSNGFSANNDVLVEGIVAARMTNDGVVMLVDDGDCRVEWRTDESTTGASVALPSAACVSDAGFTVDPDSGRAWVAAGQVWGVDAAGSRQLDVTANLVDFDIVSGVTFLANRGDRDVSALDADGGLAWTRSAAYAVHHLADMGALGAVAVVSGDFSGARLEAFDGASGDSVASFHLPDVAEISVSSDAGTVGLLHPGAIDSYSVFEGPDPVQMNAFEAPPPMYLD